LQVLLRGAWEIRRVEWALGDGHIASGIDERLKLGVGDLISLHPEAVDADPMSGRFLRIMQVRPHRVRLCRDPGQSAHEAGVAKISAQSFFILTTVQFSRPAVSNACSAPAV
jgi:hypothetical protein